MLYSPASSLVFNPVQLSKWFRHLGRPLRNRSYLPSETVSSGSHIRISSSNSCLSLLATQADKFSSFTLNDANNSLNTGFYSPNLSSSLPISHLIPHSSSASSFLVACIEPVSSRQASRFLLPSIDMQPFTVLERNMTRTWSQNNGLCAQQ